MLKMSQRHRTSHMFCQSHEAKIDLVKALPSRLLSVGLSVDEMANRNIGAFPAAPIGLLQDT